MRGLNRRRLIYLLLLVSVALGTIYVAVSRGERDLTTVGRRITDLRPNPGVWNATIIGWLPDEKLLACYFSTRPVRNYYTVDLRAGFKTLLPNLDAALTDDHNIDAGTLSPNRQLLLYGSLRLMDQFVQDERIVVRLDGTVIDRWTGNGSFEWIWSLDNVGGYGLHRGNQKVSTWSLKERRLRPISSPHLLPENYLPGWQPLGPIQNGALVYSQTEQPGRYLQIGRIDSRGQQLIGKFKVPFDGYCKNVTLSPNERKLALLVTYDMKTPESAWLRKINSWLNIRSGHFESIWTANVDGSDLREVGFVNSTDLRRFQRIGGTGWLPDAKRLWFDYDNSVWTVPVKP